MSDEITIDGVLMAWGAAANVEAAGVCVAADVSSLRAGKSAATLLAECVDGAEDAGVIADWHDYVEAVERAAAVKS